MSDPRCIVCRGTGFVRDSAGRDEPCACKNFVPRDGANQSLAELMAVGMRRAQESDAHRQECTARPCSRCERFLCRGCRAPYDGSREDARCDACRDVRATVDALAKVQATVPKKFAWAFEPDGGPVCDRVRANPELVRRALANPPSGDMLLQGDTGAGKTSLAVAMLAAWVRKDPRARSGSRFAESWWLAGALSRHPLGQGEPPEIRIAKSAPLLIIDDLGSEVDDRRGVIAEVIFSRYNDDLPIWVTSGFAAEPLIARYGSQVVRRFVEHGKVVQLGVKS